MYKQKKNDVWGSVVDNLYMLSISGRKIFLNKAWSEYDKYRAMGGKRISNKLERIGK